MKLVKNQFLNQSCIILGNGPSLTLDVIDQIDKSKLFTFAVNGFSLLFEKTNFRPSVVCMENYSAIQTYAHQYPSNVLKFFKAGWKQNVSHREQIKNVYELPFLCSHDLGVHKARFIKDGYFSIDPFKENFCGDTVILDFAIPLAFYMGFSKMFLCGVDTDYSKGHFTENYISAEISKNSNYKSMINDDYSIAVPGYHYTCNFLTSRGRKIYKLTKSNRLDFIESVSMDDIFKT